MKPRLNDIRKTAYGTIWRYVLMTALVVPLVLFLAACGGAPAPIGKTDDGKDDPAASSYFDEAAVLADNLVCQTFKELPVPKKADILWIIDNSGSMQAEQDQLKSSVGAILNLLDGKPYDFNMGVATTDMDDPDHQGQLQGNPIFSHSSDPDWLLNVETTIGNLGTDGSGTEKGLEASKAAKELGDDFNAGFYREDATLQMIYLSDEEDHSPDTVEDYLAYFAGQEHMIHFIGHLGPDTCHNSTDEPGYEYVKATLDTTYKKAGQLHSICETDWTGIVEELFGEIFEQKLCLYLDLEEPDPKYLEVTKDGATYSDWSYDAEKNAICATTAFKEGEYEACTIPAGLMEE